MPIGICGAMEGGGVSWFIAGLVSGVVEKMVWISLEHAAFLEKHVTPFAILLVQKGSTFICMNGFLNVQFQ